MTTSPPPPDDKPASPPPAGGEEGDELDDGAAPDAVWETAPARVLDRHQAATAWQEVQDAVMDAGG